MDRPQATLFSFRLIPVIAKMLAAAGIDTAALLREAELPLEAADGEITAPLGRIQTFVELCAKHAKAPLFGLDLAEEVPRGTYGIAEFVVRAAPSVRHGLEALCELSPLLNPQNNMRYVADQRGCEVHFSYAAMRDGLGMQLNEYTIAFVIRQFAAVLGHPLPVHRAWFAHARPRHADDVAKRLGCSVLFQCPDSGFAAAADVIARPTAGADPALFAFLLTQARAQLSHMGRNDIVAQVVRVIEARFDAGELTAGAIAEAMSTTQRSLQRHLAEAGTSFRAVLAHVRQRRRGELARNGLSETEIAERLGFANARSMRRSLDDGDDGPTAGDGSGDA